MTEVSNIQFSSPKIPTFTSLRSEVNLEAVGRRRPRSQGVAFPAVLSLLLHSTSRYDRYMHFPAAEMKTGRTCATREDLVSQVGQSPNALHRQVSTPDSAVIFAKFC
jgi:hypothetical protein